MCRCPACRRARHLNRGRHMSTSSPTSAYRRSVVIAAALIAACSHRATPTSPVDNALASQLAGTWRLVSIQPTGESEQQTPAGAEYNVTFDGDHVSAQADCNRCAGTFSVSGQKLSTGQALACTRAACLTMAFETKYTKLLTGDHTVALADRTLVLTSADGVMRFTR